METCNDLHLYIFGSLFLGNSHEVAHLLIEKPVEGTDAYFNPGRNIKTVPLTNWQLLTKL